MNMSLTTAITVEPDPPLRQIGVDNSVYLVTVHDDGSQTCEIVDALAEEKEKEVTGIRGGARPKAVARAPQHPQRQAQQPPQGVSDDRSQTEEREAGLRRKCDTEMKTDDARKYRQTPGLREGSEIAALGEKIATTPVSLTLREVLAEWDDGVFDMNPRHNSLISCETAKQQQS